MRSCPLFLYTSMGRCSIPLTDPCPFMPECCSSSAALHVAAGLVFPISALAYAIILVSLHVGFVVIYLWRVRFRELDGGDYRSIAARVLGLAFCIVLLWLVAKFTTTSDDVKLWVLAIELLGLCAVHTLILTFLMVRVRLPGRMPSKTEAEATPSAP
uniref:Uncharacterized protein n=1 Tax=Chrysotila carterae TaxID=13221 RepID=A0A7S4AZD3_CHRCT